MSKNDKAIAPEYSAIQVLQIETAWQKNPEQRAAMTLGCKDASHFKRVKDAGETKYIDGNEVQVMHNGLYVLRDGYQGTWESKIIEGLGGVHEPQEEKVFNEVLKHLDSGSVMMELGSWWSYYSLWFLKTIDKSRVYCTEPDPVNMKLGKRNAKINGFIEDRDIYFRSYAAGDKDGKIVKFKTEAGDSVTVPVRTVDSIIKQEKINKIDILHFDIQGAELKTLRGAINAIKAGSIRFIFISTHHYSISGDPNIHQKCIDFIEMNGGHIIAKHTVNESCSGDGLIVASFDKKDIDFKVSVSLQSVEDSLFRIPEQDTAILCGYYDKLRIQYMEKVHLLHEELDRKQNEINKLQQRANELDSVIKDITPLSKHIKHSVKAKVKKSNQGS
jgi:FkbM family methyltransferase